MHLQKEIAQTRVDPSKGNAQLRGEILCAKIDPTKCMRLLLFGQVGVIADEVKPR